MLALMWAFCANISTAVAGLVTTEMYTSTDPAGTTLFSDATTYYLYFEAMQTVVLKDVEFFGQPVTGSPLNVNDQIHWQLFQTTPGWQTPDGNNDRLFYATTQFPQNLGLSNYLTPVFNDPSQSLCGPTTNPVGNCPDNLVLEQGSFYFLSLQITGPDNWLMQSYTNGTGQQFLTSDGLYLVSGYSGAPYGAPNPSLEQGWSLITDSIPEPATLNLFGAGLAGAAFVRRRPAPKSKSVA